MMCVLSIRSSSPFPLAGSFPTVMVSKLDIHDERRQSIVVGKSDG